MLISPSILSADFLNLGSQIRMLNRAADMIHLDVMDGTFVPNISFGFGLITSVARESTIPLDAHLMIVNPDKYFERFAKAGVDMLSFHLEAALDAGRDPAELLRAVRALGMKSGLAFDPDVPVEDCFPYLDEADYIVVMSVFAGFGGQKFIPASLDRVRTLKAEIARRGLPCLVEIDGGVTAENAAGIAASGADILVAGNAVFGAADPEAAIARIKGD
ncbi:MAG: ribulose-phosphate 3-epimerase [Bacteroidales bacterium]|nr:ribulose-phosphate 3-epimerase [Bacteroidales bacterium]MBP5389450.1 ribulose-phosphate 3-epimerase [Bacteroidales bacterium]MBP5635399.1 ribulose-phosphate 3-epimerase [Bacteroidales bacterium]